MPPVKNLPAWLLRLSLFGVGCLALHGVPVQAQVIAGSAVYVRQDSDHTTVIAPRLHVGAPVDDATRVDLVYTTDIWTSASIDIRASASKPVTEQRDELTGSVTHQFNDVSVNGAYRYSHESDYESHGGTLGASFDLAEKSTTLDLRLSGAFDEVGRAGDPGFHRPVRNMGARVGITQLLDSQTYIQVLYELMDAHGYNSSPYRFIGIGTANALCSTAAYYCIPEASPSERVRHAFAVNFKHALGNSFSVGLGYRFYLDSWDVMSHTLLGELAWNMSRDTILSLRYRFYTQGSASHYSSHYDVGDSTRQYYTNDKELSSFQSHRVALDLEHAFTLDERGHELDVVLSAAPSIFLYSNYVPLNQITAIELTLATVLKL
jgi:hypothetical protein